MKEFFRSKKRTVITAIAVVCVVISSVAAILAVTQDSAKLVFSGMSMKMSGGSTQGMIDITLKETNAEAVAFTLKYNKNYIEPSSYIDNHVYTGPGTLGVSDVFKQNTSILPEGVFDKESAFGIKDLIGEIGSDNLPITETGEGTISVMLQVLPGADEIANNQYVRVVTDPDGFEHTEVVANTVDGISLGKLSFRINNPPEFARLSDAELKDVLSITSVTADGQSVDDVAITYYDEDNLDGYYRNQYSSTEYVNFDWDIQKEMVSVVPLRDSVTLLASEVYYSSNYPNKGTATEKDLINYANKYLNKLLVTYSDNSQIIENITWDESSFSGVYDALGGEYTLEQDYNKFRPKMTITVEPVTLLGFTADINKLSYIYASRNDIPERDDELELPEEAYGILDRTYDLADVTVITPLESWTHTPSYAENNTAVDDMKSQESIDAGDTRFDFKSDITKDMLENEYPWLTVNKDLFTINAVRNILPLAEQTLAPNGVTSIVEDESGNLVISVEGLGEENLPIDTDKTDFNIYFPNGQIIPSTDFGVTVVQPEGEGGVQITIDSSELDNTDIRQVIQEMINLGGKGNFKISAVAKNEDPAKPGIESKATPFDVHRNNYYKESIELDFTDSKNAYRSSIIPLAEGTPLANISTYLDFYDIDTNDIKTRIPTTYDGVGGSEPGYLSKVKVVEWKLFKEDGTTPMSDTVLPPEGTTCYLIGEYENYTYSNFGEVTNKDAYELKLKITTSQPIELNEAVTVTSDGEEYNPTHDYNFGDISLYYSADETPNNEFTINNIGTSAIAGLNVHTDSTDFVIDRQPAKDLPVSASDTFVIRAKHGLGLGLHEATVYVSSNNTEVLQSFKIKVNVVDDAVYTVNLSVRTSAMGTATLKDGQTSYVRGSTVQIKVTPGMDYAYSGKYESVPTTILTQIPTPAGGDPNSYYYEFQIERNTSITIIFDETPESLLHLADLRVLDKEGVQLLPLKALDENGVYQPVTFDPAVKDYKLDVKATVDLARVWAQPKNMKIGESIINTVATLYYSASEENPNNLLTRVMSDFVHDGGAYMNSELFGLLHSPQINKFEIKRSYVDEDGEEHSITYTINIVRQPLVKVQLNYGNSPYGLIERDIDPADVAMAKKDFDDYRHYGQDHVPSTAQNNNCGADITYTREAWLNTSGQYDDMDRDPSALFVYVGDTTEYGENMNFTDPGWIGKVEVKKNGTTDQYIEIDPATIKRTIKLYKYSSSLNDPTVQNDILDFYEGTVVSGTTERRLDTFVKTIDGTASRSGANNVNGIATFSGLSGIDFRPGIYKIEYDFKYEDNGEEFESAFERNLIVLARPGNLRSRVSETIDEVDSRLIYNYNKSLFAQEFIIPARTNWRSVVTYRVMDVNLDGNVNSIDANNIKQRASDMRKRLYVPTASLVEEGDAP